MAVYEFASVHGAITFGTLVGSLSEVEITSMSLVTAGGDNATVTATARGGSSTSNKIINNWELTVTYHQNSAFFRFIQRMRKLQNTPTVGVNCIALSSLNIVDLSPGGGSFSGTQISIKSGADLPKEAEIKEISTVLNIGFGEYIDAEEIF